MTISLETMIKVSHLRPERMCIGFFFGFGERERVNIPCRILIKETVFHALMCPLQTLLLLDKTEKNQTKDSQAQTSSASQRNKNGANM